MTPDDMSRLLQAHRSVRQYQDKPLDAALVDRVLAESLAGASSSGNLNMVSVIKTRDTARKAHLCALHFDQPMVLQAPLVLTFCADTHRTRTWLAQRGARLGFGDLLSWHVAAFDAVILAQTSALTLESHGLGVCYMGTTLHRMREIADYLQCPDHVLPVTSLVVGWPAEAPPQRDRLPAAAWLHDEVYQRPTPGDIDQHFTGGGRAWPRALSGLEPRDGAALGRPWRHVAGAVLHKQAQVRPRPVRRGFGSVARPAGSARLSALIGGGSGPCAQDRPGHHERGCDPDPDPDAPRRGHRLRR